MNRKLKKYNLKYEYLKLELEDVGDELQKYIEDFELYFDKFYHQPPPGKKYDETREVWVNEDTGEVRNTPPPNFVDDFNKHWENYKKESEEKERQRVERVKELKSRPEKLKRLYKKLAAKVHPDLGGSNELFQEVNKAYESNNLMTLLTMAGEYEIDYEVDNSDEKVLERNLTEVESEINRMRSTLAWTWGTGDLNDRKFVVGRVEKETGWKIPPKDLPIDLQPVDDSTKLLNEPTKQIEEDTK